MGGKSFLLENNQDILNINSPRHRVGGPYAVVHKDIEARWAIVALDWEGKPRLGIRWFHGSRGTPQSSSYPTWLIVPHTLSRAVLSGLPLEHDFHRRIDDFLAGTLEGVELQPPS